MKKQSEVDDSLEFCKEIKYYEEKTPSLEFDEQRDPDLKEYLNWVDKTDDAMRHDFNKYEKMLDLQEAKEEGRILEALEEEIKSPYEEVVETPKKRTLLKDVVQILGCILIAFLLVYSVTTYLATYTRVHGESMENTLKDGDVVLINRLSYRFHEPEQFDTIVFRHKSGVNLVKRIIAKPGETVQIVDGTIFVNGEVVNENYGKETIENAGQAELPMTLGEDEYFVLGDNRNLSTDSRSTYVGLVKRSDIVGKVMFRVYPFNHIGTIE